MASKIGVILSLMFVVVFFLFASDMMTLQYIYSDLDSTAVTVGYLMAKEKIIDDSFSSYITSLYNISFYYDGPAAPDYGQVVDFTITKSYKPIIISPNELNVHIKRTAVIGYYG